MRPPENHSADGTRPARHSRRGSGARPGSGPVRPAPFSERRRRILAQRLGEPAFTLMSGGRRSGRVRNALACPGLPGAAEARVREVGSQPTVPVSAIPAAPAESAPRNLRRVIVPPSLPLPAHFSAKSVLSPAWPRTRPQTRTSLAHPQTESTLSGTPAIPGNPADLPRKPATLQASSPAPAREAEHC